MNQATQGTKEQLFHATALCVNGLMKKFEPTITISEQLMPYGAVAKAIFIKANGLAAYNKAFCCGNLYCPEDYEQASA
jgi:hypothetical protein